ncbi:Allene oxide synthase 3 [Bienertia sinuspersici]
MDCLSLVRLRIGGTSFTSKGSTNFFRHVWKNTGLQFFRVNMPPGPWVSKDPRVIVLLDGKSFPVLFDNSKVEKKNVFVGTYMPSTSFTGGIRVCSYLDPSEQKHHIFKSLLFSTLASRHKDIIPMFQEGLQGLFSEVEKQVKETGRGDFNPPSDNLSLEIFFRIFCDDQKPTDTILGSDGPSIIKKWVIFQISPLQSLVERGGLPKFLIPIEDLVLHSIGLPSFLVKGNYKKLYEVFSTSGKTFLDKAESEGMKREEAIHQLLFFASFNSSFGVSQWFPALMYWIASAGEILHRELAREIRSVVKSEGGVTMNAINKMVLTKSVILETFRIEPPVPYQYGRAKSDLVIQSHDAEFKVKKGEMIFGFQPFATNDPKIFSDPDKFKGNRFVGEKGKELMKYVYWSNGKNIDDPTPDDKQCAGKNIVELLSAIMVAEFFLRYDTFTVDYEAGTKKLTIKSLKKATSSG